LDGADPSDRKGRHRLDGRGVPAVPPPLRPVARAVPLADELCLVDRRASPYRFFLSPGAGPPLGFLAPLLLPGPLSPTSHLRSMER
jgi:hypothetical protein